MTEDQCAQIVQAIRMSKPSINITEQKPEPIVLPGLVYFFSGLSTGALLSIAISLGQMVTH